MKLTIFLALAWFNLLLLSTPTPSQAQLLAQIQFTPSADVGIPGRRVGAGTRGQCLAPKTPMTALVPVTSATAGRAEQEVGGLTTTGHPVFWFYLPYRRSSRYIAEFVLQDDREQEVYRTQLSLPTEPGIGAVRLPTTLTPLTVGKTYRWYLMVFCDRRKTSPPVFLAGGIRRVELPATLAQQLATAPAREKVVLYAKHGIWYDALTTLAELRQAQPNDAKLKMDWDSLLQSVGLQTIGQNYSPAHDNVI